jgi:hypothetical protein
MLPATDGYWSTMPIPSVCITATSWGRGGVWLNTGTWLIEAARFVEIIDERQGLRIARPGETAAASALEKSGYGQYMRSDLRHGDQRRVGLAPKIIWMRLPIVPIDFVSPTQISI